jgi:hypothetical protein
MGRLEALVARLSAGQMTAIFTVVNVLNYIDRGIQPVRGGPRSGRSAAGGADGRAVA